MSQDRIKYAVAHFSVGFMSSLLILFHAVLGFGALVAGVLLEILFIIYEILDWLVKKDRPQYQIMENAAGFVAGIIVYVVVFIVTQWIQP